MDGKKLLQSKTFWVALIQALIGVVIVFETHFPNVGALIIGKSLLDMILRIFTDKPITV